MTDKNRYLLLLLLAVLSGNIFAQKTDLTRYVNPLAGTASSTTPSAVKHGSTLANFANTIPSVCTPFGMTQWTAQTQATENKCIPPYYYKDDMFSGFRGSHWISGSCTQDYGSVTIMPISGKLNTANYAARFKHEDESATPYLYKINLKPYNLHAAVTATARCAAMEFTADAADSLYLLVTPNSDFGEGYIKIDADKGEIYGYNPVHRIYQGWGKPAGFSGYFIIKIEKVIRSKGTFAGAQVFLSDSIKTQKSIGAFVGFKMNKNEKLKIVVATSFTGFAGARKNLNAEIHDDSFKIITAKCKANWQKTLAQVRVKTANKAYKHIFYTSFYHAMQLPRLYNDVDGLYPRFSSYYKNEKLSSGNYYDDFSLWDIYRSQIPLLEILKPKLADNLVQSLLLKGQQGGWLPIFPCWNSYTSEMIGDHTTSVIASAYLKGISKQNINEAYKLMRLNAFELPPSKAEYIEGKGRRALDSYIKYGYIPLEDSVKDAFHKMEQVSRTMEYAYDDYALALVAKKLGNGADYSTLIKRAKNYQNIFNPALGFVSGRMQNGDWVRGFNPDVKQSYITEGTPRQYTFYVPQDVQGLTRLMGGTQKLEQALDSIFIKKEYWHGNEPGHQIPFMYNYTANSWKTQKEVRTILAEEYSDGPGGLGGNDDAGQMSAWYMFAAMGFYPLNPVSGEYLLCSPIFDEVNISLPSDKTLSIICHKTTAKAMYIYKATWNGTVYSKNYIEYKNIVNGGKLDLYLTEQPNKKWAIKAADQPGGISK